MTYLGEEKSSAKVNNQLRLGVPEADSLVGPFKRSKTVYLF